MSAHSCQLITHYTSLTISKSDSKIYNNSIRLTFKFLQLGAYYMSMGGPFRKASPGNRGRLLSEITCRTFDLRSLCSKLHIRLAGNYRQADEV